jgi:hypothetical protein
MISESAWIPASQRATCRPWLSAHWHVRVTFPGPNHTGRLPGPGGLSAHPGTVTGPAPVLTGTLGFVTVSAIPSPSPADPGAGRRSGSGPPTCTPGPSQLVRESAPDSGSRRVSPGRSHLQSKAKALASAPLTA